MKLILLTLLALVGLDSILGTSVVIRNNTVYLDEKPVDLTKLEVLDDLPHAKRYHLQSNGTNITITESKFHNALTIETSSPMTKEDLAKMEAESKKVAEKIDSHMKAVGDEMKAIQDKINKDLENMFKGFGI